MVQFGQHGGEDSGGGHPDSGHPVLDKLSGHGGQVLTDIIGSVQRHHASKLLSQLQSEPPVSLIVHLEELFQSGQICIPSLHGQQREEVG